jgi:hypothetical protein
VKSNSPFRPFAETLPSPVWTLTFRFGHADLEFDAAIVDSDGEMGVRLAQLDVDRVSLLMFHDFHSSGSEMPAAGGYARLNLVLIPGFDVDAGVAGFDAQLGLGRQVVGFGPIVGAGGSGEGG